MLKAGRTASKTALLQIKMKFLKRTICFIVICAAFVLPRFCFAGDWQISGDNTYVTNGTRVGIGDSSPLAQFEFEGTRNPISDLNDVADYNMVIRSEVNTVGSSVGIGFMNDDDEVDVGASILYVRTGAENKGELRFYTKFSTSAGADPVLGLLITDSQNIGIGTTTATQKLTVDGNGQITQDLYVDGKIYLNGVELTQGGGETPAATSSLSLSREYINGIGTIEIRGTIGADEVDIIVYIPFFLWLMLAILLFICLFIIFKTKWN